MTTARGGGESPKLVKLETQLRSLGLAYPMAVEEFPWDHRAIKVKGKMFVILSFNEGKLNVTVKLPHSNKMALNLPFAEPTGYGLGKSGWVTASFSAADDVPVEMLHAWMDESYRAIAPKKLVQSLDAMPGKSAPAKVVKTPEPKATPKKLSAAKKTAAKPAAKKTRPAKRAK